MRDFLEGHRCNAICRHLQLPAPVTNGITDAPGPVYVPPVHGSMFNPYAGSTFSAIVPSIGVVYEEEEYEEDYGY